MTVLALDVGDRRLGVAVSDPTELVSRPLAVIVRRSNALDSAAIRRLAEDHGADRILVGVPLSSDGTIGPQAQKVLAFVRYLRRALPQEIITADESYSTVEARRELIAQGTRRSQRKQMIDAAAAAVLLDEWLATHSRRRAGRAPPPEAPKSDAGEA